MQTNMILGIKLGMTRIFDNTGANIPVTIIEAGPCVVTQVSNSSSGEFSNIQLAYQDKKETHTTKPMLGHFKKAGITPKRYLQEFRIKGESDYSLGDIVGADTFKAGDKVLITGTSKGKGFAGHMKRHGFAGGRASHGKNSVMRKAGSVGSSATPSRIWAGTKMAGNMGHDKITLKNVKIVRVDMDTNQIFVKGAVPGATNGLISIAK